MKNQPQDQTKIGKSISGGQGKDNKSILGGCGKYETSTPGGEGNMKKNHVDKDNKQKPIYGGKEHVTNQHQVGRDKKNTKSP